MGNVEFQRRWWTVYVEELWFLGELPTPRLTYFVELNTPKAKHSLSMPFHSVRTGIPASCRRWPQLPKSYNVVLRETLWYQLSSPRMQGHLILLVTWSRNPSGADVALGTLDWDIPGNSRVDAQASGVTASGRTAFHFAYVKFQSIYENFHSRK